MAMVCRRAACFTILVAQLVFAAPADLNLGITALNRIIRGAQIPINSGVFNDAPAGSDDLNYSLYYTLPNGMFTVPVTGTRAADGGAGYDPWTYTFNSAGAP